jgi:hypothetical protein
MLRKLGPYNCFDMRIADEIATSTRPAGALFAVGDDTGLLTALIGDGRPLLALVALGLMLSGIFALFLSVTGTFLPHDVSFLGMQPRALCDLHQCRIVHFIFHDRVSFGGTLLAIGTLYLWLVAFPLRLGEEWAWWTLLLSGVVGFLSFLTYLIYGYLDSWHGVATAGLLPLFVGGIWKTRGLLPAQREGWRSLLQPGMPMALGTRGGFGRACLLFVGAGMALAGSVITVLGSTVVFVPQDITYLGFTAAQLNAINSHLIPLIAHDRAGFGGGLASCGLTVLFIAWKARPGLALWQALLVGGISGFGCAIGVHYTMDYLIVSHLAPAWIGAAIYAVGVVCLFPASQNVTLPTNDRLLR